MQMESIHADLTDKNGHIPLNVEKQKNVSTYWLVLKNAKIHS